MDKIWLKNYPEGMPAEIDPDQFRSIPDLLDKLFVKFADRPAYHNLGHTISYAELEQLSRAFAAFLQGLPGMGKGERVAVMSPNLLQYPVVLFGILRAGMTVVNVNPLYTPRELEHQLKDSGAKAIVIVENFAQSLQQVMGRTAVEHVVTTQIGNLFAQRTDRISAFRIGWFTNGLLWAGIFSELVVIFLIVYVPPVQRLIGTQAFEASNWIFLFAWAPLLLFADEGRKFLLRSYERRANLGGRP